MNIAYLNVLTLRSASTRLMNERTNGRTQMAGQMCPCAFVGSVAFSDDEVFEWLRKVCWIEAGLNHNLLGIYGIF